MKRARLVFVVLAFLLGVGLIAYPYVSDYVHRQQQQEVITIQAETVEQISEEERSAELAAAHDYNERLNAGRTVVTDPFDADAQRVTSEEYESLLNLGGDGVMGTLYIPKIDLQMPIYHYTNDAELQRGVGHMESTSLPVGGPSTHAVLAGHNGLPSVKIFDRLDELEVGDYFVIEVLGEDHAYRVTSKETVLPEETESLVVVPGEDLMTLVTCTPYGVNTHRLLVHAERCELPASWGETDREQLVVRADEPDVPLLEFTLVGLAIAAGLGISAALASRRMRKSRGGASSAARSTGSLVRVPRGAVRPGPPRGKHFASGAPNAPSAGSSRRSRSDDGQRVTGVSMTGAAGVRPVPVRRRRGGRGRRG